MRISDSHCFHTAICFCETNSPDDKSNQGFDYENLKFSLSLRSITAQKWGLKWTEE